jgi:hypothetical protein
MKGGGKGGKKMGGWVRERGEIVWRFGGGGRDGRTNCFSGRMW